jgi:hypothetical protein
MGISAVSCQSEAWTGHKTTPSLCAITRVPTLRQKRAIGWGNRNLHAAFIMLCCVSSHVRQKGAEGWGNLSSSVQRDSEIDVNLRTIIELAEGAGLALAPAVLRVDLIIGVA